MSGRRTIGNTFVVNTVDDPVGLVAQYCATATPSSSSQIHTIFQTGDLYMRTRTTEETFSGYVDPNHPWNRIVGESGGETDYQFAISANKVSQDGTSATAPTDISSSDWQNAPLIVTTAKPYLWSKVQKKDGGGNNVGNPSYMRLTGEESIEYSVEGALNTIKVGTGQTSTLVSCTYTFYQKPAVSSIRSTVSCYYAVYLRSGNTFSLLTMGTGYNNHGSGTSVTINSNVPYKSGSVVYNAVVIYIFPSSYYSTSPESQNYMAKKEIPIVKDGDTAFVVDLENEMVSIEADEYGSTTKQYNFSSAVRAFYGATNVIADCTVTVSANDPDIDALFNSGTKNLEVLIPVGTNTYDTVTVTITVTHSTYGTRTATFIISKIYAGTDASIQELLPSLNEISFARQADKTLSPASRDLTLSFKKTKGNETTTQTIAESGLTIRWSVASMPTTSRGGTAWGSGNVTGITWNSNTMTIANSIAESNIYIACFNSSGTLVDRETIPIIKDGQHGNDGDDAAAAFVSTNAITIQCDSDGNVSSSQTTSINFSMKVGTHNATVSGHTSPSTLPTGVSIIDDAATACRITVGTSATASGIKNGITFTVTGTYNSKTYSANVTVALIGVCKGGNGSRGKTGRFYYYAGEFDVNDNTHTFFVNDAQAPYFNTVGTKFHVYNSDTNGSFTMAQMGDDFKSKPWEIMTNDFKYIITEAIFGKYAHFGSFIINGDWMLSQHGTLVSSGGTEIIVDESNQDIQYDNGATTIVLNGNSVNSGLIVCQVSFKVDTNTQVSITITPSSESNFDFGAVGELDSVELKNATAAKIKDNRVTSLIKASGTTAASTTVNVSAGTHFFYIAYAKDGSSAQGSDNATFSFGSLTYSVDLVKKNNGMTYTSPKWGVAYTWFDAQDPLAKTIPSTGYKFRPNFAVDALTGSTYQNKAYVAGNILTPYLRITNDNYSNYQHTNFMNEVCLWLDKSGFNVQIEASSITQIKLPRITSDMLGSEINIFNATTGNIEVYGSGSLTGQSSQRYFCPLIKPSEASNLRTNFNIYISKFREAKFKAIDNGYVGNTDEETERYRYSWLCCYANINP